MDTYSTWCPGHLPNRTVRPNQRVECAESECRRHEVRYLVLKAVASISAVRGSQGEIQKFLGQQHWVGGTSDNATTFQFVAKFHDLLMQASLVNVLLYIIRVQAFEGCILFGVLSGAAQAPQISYLWSLDFVSALKSPDFLCCRKTFFAISAIALLFMASVVGPSSAVLMIPRPDMTYVHSEITLRENLSEDHLFPTEIYSTHGLNL